MYFVTYSYDRCAYSYRWDLFVRSVLSPLCGNQALYRSYRGAILWHCPKSRNIKLNFFLGWITSSVLSSGHFSYWAILISPVVLSTLCFDAVFMIDIIIMVYSTLIISCSPSFVKGGICISPPICFCKDTPFALVSIGHDTYFGGSSNKGLHRTGVIISVFQVCKFTDM